MTTDPAGRVAPHSGGTTAELVARLRTEGRVYTHMEAADLLERQHAEIERLRAALTSIAATVTDPSVMQKWDTWRRYIAQGGGTSYPRDEFEALIDSIATEAKAALAPAEEEKG